MMLKIAMLLITLAMSSIGMCGGHDGQWKFLVPSTNHEGESPLHPGKGWLALVRMEGKWRLVNTEVKARKVESGITDYDVEISSSNKNTIALVRHDKISPGKVSIPQLPAEVLTREYYFDRGRSVRFEFVFGGKEYSVHTRRAGNQEWGDHIAYDLVISSDGVVSVVGVAQAGWNEDYVFIEWIGDLDRDGRPDVLVNSNGSNSSGWCLLLSSEAKPGELFGKHRCHIGTGC